MPFAVETHRLTKIYPPRRGWLRLGKPVSPPVPAVREVSLRVERGEIFGLLGPNGAGKTTLIKMLTTLIVPTSGEGRVNGCDLRAERAIKASIGLVTAGERSFYWRLSGLQNLEFFAALHGLPPAARRERALSALEQVGLRQAAGQRVSEYSTGMHKRLAIARALLHRPDILFFDEPTTGLDPQAALALHALILRLAERGKTVFLSTHYLPEAEKLCGRVGILHRGVLRAVGTVAELRREIPWEPRYHVQVDALPEAARRALESQLGGLRPAADAPPETDFTLQGDAALSLALEHIPAPRLRALIPARPSLEEIFAKFTEDHVSPRTEYKVQRTPPNSQPATPNPQPPSSSQSSAVSRQSSPVHRPPSTVSGQPSTVHRHHSAFIIPHFSFRIPLAFLQRDWRIERSYRLAFLLQLGQMLFSAGVFYFLGELVNGLDLRGLRAYGGDYFAFVLIGLAMRGYFSTALNGFSQSIRTEQTTGTLEAMLTTPARLESLIFGAAGWAYLMTTVQLGLYLGLGAALGRLHLAQANLGAAALTLALSLVTYSSLGVLAASFIMLYKRGNPVTWIFQAVSDFLGGMYYPVEVLPSLLQAAAAFLPVTYSLRAMRLSLLQNAPWSALWPDLGALAGFALLSLPLGAAAFRYAVRRARVEGSLVGY